MAMDCEEDELLYEIDVMMASGLKGQLSLFQYPVSFKNSGTRNLERVSSAKIKPISKKIEMELHMDTSSDNYDKSKGELIAINVDGAAGPSTSYNQPAYQSGQMDRQKLISSSVQTGEDRLLAGVIQNGALHLTPISSVQKLRPSFEYIDKSETKAAEKKAAKAANDGDSSQDEMEDAKAVTLRFKGAESDISKILREQSYASHEKRIADEKWVPTAFHHVHDSYAERERLRLLTTIVKPESNDGYYSGGDSCTNNIDCVSANEYKKILLPNYTGTDDDLNSASDIVKYTSQNQAGELSNEVQKIMQNAKIIQFNHIMSILPRTADSATVVQLLPVFASLVQGLWIVKSEEIYPPKTLSPISGIPSEYLCRARDYILYKFTKSKYLCRQEVVNAVKIPNDDVLTLFQEISYLKRPKGWRLRFSRDKEFIKNFPQQAERQKLLWTSKYNQLVRYYALVDGNQSERFSTSEDEAYKPIKCRGRTRRASNSKSQKLKVGSPTNLIPPKFEVGKSPPFNAQQNKNIKPMIKTERISDSEMDHQTDGKPFVVLKPPQESDTKRTTPIGINIPPEVSNSINIDNVNSTIAEISTEFAKVSPGRKLPPFYMAATDK